MSEQDDPYYYYRKYWNVGLPGSADFSGWKEIPAYPGVLLWDNNCVLAENDPANDNLNEIAQFAKMILESEYLQRRKSSEDDRLAYVHYLRDLADDIEDGVIRVENFILDVPDIGSGFYRPPKGQHGRQTLLVNGKKNIALIYYEYNESK